MEKQIKSLIAERVDLTNAYFADEIRKTMGHSLERSIQFLIKILPFKDEFSRQQVETQIVKQVLGDVHFQGLNNKLRYPVYSTRYQSYAFLVIEKNETDELHKMLSNLKIYLQDLSVRI